ncbi:hypothetical protein ACFWRB_36125 [Streptomyces bacillaris]|uniref:hypothetical protein n=1 Tax=Streptomyces bacillaris TaxID=68179 RepID=UPI0036481891
MASSGVEALASGSCGPREEIHAGIPDEESVAAPKVRRLSVAPLGPMIAPIIIATARHR